MLSRLTLVVALGVSMAMAGTIDSTAPGCQSGDLASYVALGSGGCSAGGLTYSNFKFESFLNLPVGPDTLIADATNIFVTPPNISGGSVDFYSNNFVVGEGDSLSYLFGYTIDPPPDILPGFDLFMDAFSPVFPGFATIDAVVCAGGNLSQASIVAPFCIPVESASSFRRQPYLLHVEHSVTPNVIDVFDTVQFDNPTNYIQVFLLLTLDGGPLGGGGSSQINGIKTLNANPQEVPEPGTWMMLAAGLVTFGVARRRR